MATSRRTLTGVAIVLLLIAIGLGTGYSLKNLRGNTGTAPAPSLEQSAPPPAEPDINTTLYDVSPPSRGRAHKTIKIDFTTFAGNTAMVFLPVKDAATIAPGQSVLLYNRDGMLLTIVGKVTNVAKGEGTFADLANISIDIPAAYDVPARSAVHGEIITQVFPLANRLPLSALQKDADGKPYIWEVLESPTATMVQAARRPLSSTLVIDDFFMFENPDRRSNLYILSPDAALEDGQIIAHIRKVLYAAPSVTNDAQIAAIPHDPPPVEAPSPPPVEGQGCGIGIACPTGTTSYIDDIIQKANNQKEAERLELDGPQTFPH